LKKFAWQELLESEKYPVTRLQSAKAVRFIMQSVVIITLLVAVFNSLVKGQSTDWPITIAICIVFQLAGLLVVKWKNMYVILIAAVIMIIVSIVYYLYIMPGRIDTIIIWAWILLVTIALIASSGILWGSIISIGIGIICIFIEFSPLGDILFRTCKIIPRMLFPFTYFSVLLVSLTVRLEVALYHFLQRRYSYENKRRIAEITTQSILAIANAIDEKGDYMQKHSVRVAEYSVHIAERLGWEDESILNMYNIALLHDIGKVRIPESILKKNGFLSAEEIRVMQNHVEAGKEMLEGLTMLPHAVEVAKYHHERYDGTGYSEGLKGEEIPIEARIVALADAFDAMTTDRAYRESPGQDFAIAQLLAERGKQFDPMLVDILIAIIKEGTLDAESETIGFVNTVTENEILLKRVITEFTQMSMSLARKDSLTDLITREDVKLQINTYLCDQRHEGTLLIMDIDNFKMINDKFGHTAGDNALIKFARLLKNAVREQDLVCRLGGDEFIVFLRDMTEKDIIISKVKSILASTIVQVPPEELQDAVSLSVGIAISNRKRNTFDELYRDADTALYRVKEQGKNGYCFDNQMNKGVI